MSKQWYGKALLAAQIASMAVGLWPGRRRWSVPWPVTVAAAVPAVGGAVFAAAGTVRLGRAFRPGPAPPRDAALRTDGVYAVVRHPIYTGLLVSGTGIAVLRARPEPVGALVVLALVLPPKARYEEQLLRERFGTAYDAYCQRVPRLVPRPGGFHHTRS